MSDRDVDRELWLLHRHLFLREGGWAGAAIDLAAELLAGGQDDEAVVELACLDGGASVADVEPLVRQLLGHRGYPVPPMSPDDSQVRSYLAWAFARELVDEVTLQRQWIEHHPSWNQGLNFETNVVAALGGPPLGLPEEDSKSLAETLRRRLGLS